MIRLWALDLIHCVSPGSTGDWTKKDYNPSCTRCAVWLIHSSNTFLITCVNLYSSVLQEPSSRANRKSSHDGCLGVHLCSREANWASLLAHWFKYWLHIKDPFFTRHLFYCRLKINEFLHGAAQRCWGRGVCVCLIMTYPPLYYAVEKGLDLLLMTWSEQTHISLPSTVFKLAAVLILSSLKTGTGGFI